MTTSNYFMQISLDNDTHPSDTKSLQKYNIDMWFVIMACVNSPMTGDQEMVCFYALSREITADHFERLLGGDKIVQLSEHNILMNIKGALNCAILETEDDVMVSNNAPSKVHEIIRTRCGRNYIRL